MTLLIALITLCGLVIAYIGFGALLVRSFGKSFGNLDPLVSLALRFYLGVGLWFYFASLLGLHGYFKFWIVLPILLVGAGAGLFFIICEFSVLSRTFKETVIGTLPETYLWKALYVLTLGLCLIGTCAIFAPVEGDGAAFYMAIAKATASSGWLEKFPGYEGFSAVGLVGEVHIATTMLLSGADLAARGLTWVMFFPVICILLRYKSIFKMSAEANIVQFVGLFSSTALFWILFGGKVDLYSAAFGFVGIYFLFFERHLFITGLLLALACVAKLSLLIPLFPVVILGVVCHWIEQPGEKRKFSSLIKLFFLIGTPFLIVSFPHFLKNIYFFQNAFAPFLGSRISWETVWFSAETTRRITLLYPLVWFYGDYWGQLGVISLPVFMFAPFACAKIFYRKNANPERFFVVSAVAGLLMWLLLRPSFVAPRYILAVLMMFIPLAGIGFDLFCSRNRGVRLKINIVVFFLIIWCLHSILAAVSAGLSPTRLLQFLKYDTDICALDGTHCRLYQTLNIEAAPGDRVMQLTYFTYWLRPDLLQTMLKGDAWRNDKKLTQDEAWKFIYEQDFKFIITDKATHEFAIDIFHIQDPPNWIRLVKIAELEQLTAYKVAFVGPMPDIAKKVKVIQNGPHWVVKDLN